MNQSTDTIPAGHVRVTRRTNRYLRSRNGAWYGSVPASEDIQIVPEARAAGMVNGEFVTVEWPDGYYEFFDCAVSPVRFSHVGTRDQCRTETVTLTAGLKEPLSFERPLSRLGRVGYYGLEAAAAPSTPAEIFRNTRNALEGESVREHLGVS